MAFTPSHLYFEDVEIGQEWRSLGRTITEADVVNFAGLSGDFNPIHVDHHFAKSTPFRGRSRTACWCSQSAPGWAAGPADADDGAPGIKECTSRPGVFGDTIYVVSKVLEKQLRGRGKRGEIAWQRRFYNQDDKLVMEGVTLTLVEGRGIKAAAGESKPERCRRGSREQ